MGDIFAWGLPIVLAGLLVSAGVEDVRHREIANWKNAAIAALAPAWWVAIGLPVWPAMVLQLGIAVLAFALFAAAFAAGMMGGGDVKMIAALALWFPLHALVWLLVVMSLVGGAITLVMLIDHKRRKITDQPEIPYGVAIACAALLSLGEPLFNHFG